MSNLVNIDQIRAANALASTGVRKLQDEGDNLSGYPSLIINNGLISAIAFSVEKKGQHERIADAIASHLAKRKIVTSKSARALRDELCSVSSITLRIASREALEFLSYLKRFHRS